MKRQHHSNIHCCSVCSCQSIIACIALTSAAVSCVHTSLTEPALSAIQQKYEHTHSNGYPRPTAATVGASMGSYNDVYKNVIFTNLMEEHMNSSAVPWTYFNVLGSGTDSRYDISGSAVRGKGVDAMYHKGNYLSAMARKDTAYRRDSVFSALLKQVRLVNGVSAMTHEALSSVYAHPTAFTRDEQHNSDRAVITALRTTPKLARDFKYFPSTLSIARSCLRSHDRIVIVEPNREYHDKQKLFAGNDRRFTLLHANPYYRGDSGNSSSNSSLEARQTPSAIREEAHKLKQPAAASTTDTTANLLRQRGETINEQQQQLQHKDPQAYAANEKAIAEAIRAEATVVDAIAARTAAVAAAAMRATGSSAKSESPTLFNKRSMAAQLQLARQRDYFHVVADSELTEAAATAAATAAAAGTDAALVASESEYTDLLQAAVYIDAVTHKYQLYGKHGTAGSIDLDALGLLPATTTALTGPTALTLSQLFALRRVEVRRDCQRSSKMVQSLLLAYRQSTVRVYEEACAVLQVTPADDVLLDVEAETAEQAEIAAAEAAAAATAEDAELAAMTPVQLQAHTLTQAKQLDAASFDEFVVSWRAAVAAGESEALLPETEAAIDSTRTQLLADEAEPTAEETARLEAVRAELKAEQAAATAERRKHDAVLDAVDQAALTALETTTRAASTKLHNKLEQLSAQTHRWEIQLQHLSAVIDNHTPLLQQLEQFIHIDNDKELLDTLAQQTVDHHSSSTHPAAQHRSVDVIQQLSRSLTAANFLHYDIGHHENVDTVDAQINNLCQHIIPVFAASMPAAMVLISYPIYGRHYQDRIVSAMMATGVQTALHSYYFPQQRQHARDTDVAGTGICIVNPPQYYEEELKRLHTWMDVIVTEAAAHNSNDGYASQQAVSKALRAQHEVDTSTQMYKNVSALLSDSYYRPARPSITYLHDKDIGYNDGVNNNKHDSTTKPDRFTREYYLHDFSPMGAEALQRQQKREHDSSRSKPLDVVDKTFDEFARSELPYPPTWRAFGGKALPHFTGVKRRTKADVKRQQEAADARMAGVVAPAARAKRGASSISGGRQ